MNLEIVLGTVSLGEDEEFRQDFSLPAEISPGNYQVLPTRQEGEQLTAEISVVPGSVEAPAEADREASGEPIVPDRSRSAFESAALIVALASAAVLGVAPVRLRG